MAFDINRYLVKYDYEIARLFKPLKKKQVKLANDRKEKEKTFEYLAYKELLNECSEKLQSKKQFQSCFCLKNEI